MNEAAFWERLLDMPAWEAEQELVERRFEIIEEQDALNAAHKRPGDAAGVKMASNARLLTLIGERIKYLRRLQAKIEWREAVQVLFGVDGYHQCATWIEEQYAEKDARRKEWAKR